MQAKIVQANENSPCRDDSLGCDADEIIACYFGSFGDNWKVSSPIPFDDSRTQWLFQILFHSLRWVSIWLDLIRGVYVEGEKRIFCIWDKLHMVKSIQAANKLHIFFSVFLLLWYGDLKSPNV